MYSDSSFRLFICFEVCCLYSSGAEESSLLECDTVYFHALCFISCLGLLTQTTRIDIYVLSCVLAQTFALSHGGMCFPCPQISTLHENCTLLGYYAVLFSSFLQWWLEITHRTFLVCRVGGPILCGL